MTAASMAAKVAARRAEFQAKVAGKRKLSTPNNPDLYNAAVRGFAAGAFFGKDLTAAPATDATYADISAQAATFAAEMDAMIPAGEPSSAQSAFLAAAVQAVYANKYSTDLPESAFEGMAANLAALYNEIGDIFVPTPPPENLPHSSIIFRPGGVAGNNVYTTTASVASVLAAQSGLVDVVVDDRFGAANLDIVWDVQSVGSVTGVSIGGGTFPATLTILDGGQIRNPSALPGSLSNLNIVCLCATVPSFDYDDANWIAGPVVTFDNNSAVDTTGATISPFQVPVSTSGASGTPGFLVQLTNGGYVSGTVPLIQLLSGGTGIETGGSVTFYGLFYIPFTANLVAGDSTTSVGCFCDASCFPIPTYVTEQFNSYGDLAVGVKYTPTTTANWSSPVPTTVQGALDDLAQQRGTGTLSSGVSANISATLAATSHVSVTRTAINGSTALGELTVVQTAGTPGHFVVTALNPASPGSALTTDHSNFAWTVVA
jgi:hypothetical protein